MENFDLKKYLTEGKLLKESSPGFKNRKTGDPLPTLDSIQEEFDAIDPSRVITDKELEDRLGEKPEYDDDDDSITYLMSQDEEIELRIKEIINYLNEIEIDGETMQHIIDSVGMDEQMLHQLTPGGIREAIIPESMVTANSKLLDENMGIEAKAWLVDDEDGLPKIIRFSSVEDAKENQFDEMADYPYNRPLFTSLEDLKTYLDAQYMYDYDIEKYRYV